MTDQPTPLFLSEGELAQLTGRKLKRLQIEQLRAMLIPFHINALGKPIVAREAIIGNKREAANSPRWQPKALSNG